MVRCDMAGTNKENESYVSNHCNVYDVVRLQKKILMNTKTYINNKMISRTLLLLLLLLLKKIGNARTGEGD